MMKRKNRTRSIKSTGGDGLKLPMSKTGQEIIELMSTGAFGPLSIKELMRRLGVAKDAREGFKRLVKEMTAEGTLVKIRGNRYGLPSRMNLVVGTLSCHPNGFGFVIPEGGGEDVFINPRSMAGAMHGDQVVTRVEGFKSRGRREGRVIRVLKRVNRTVVGRLEKTRGMSAVVPSNERIVGEIIIPPRMTLGAPASTIVEAEITKWPTKKTPAVGRVISILGDPDDPDVEVEVIIRKFGLHGAFPKKVLRELEGVQMEVSEEERSGRVDLRAKSLFTIDGETAKDFDDAVGIEKTRTGFRLWVSIADVSSYVREGSEVDGEAFLRATSVYFPDRCIPMLPEPLSTGICSLKPDVDRLTLTAELDFDHDGAPVKKRFYESVIKSAARLTYTEVKLLLSGEGEGEADASLNKSRGALVSDLKLMEELASKLYKRRSSEGSIDFDLPEPEIIIDMKGRIEDIVRCERHVAHRIIEEFMLAANRAAAEEFSHRAWPFIYRVHPAPDPDDVREFMDFVSGLGYSVKGKPGAKTFQKVLKLVSGRAEERLVNHVLLRSMKQALYSPENTGHFGLAFADYTHFTSPIRRYPDLVVHRLLKKVLTRGYTPAERDRARDSLGEVADHSSRKERRAMEAEREIADLKKAQFMEDRVGDEFEGLISGVASYGFFVELKEFFVEGLVHVTSLVDDYYSYLEKEHMLEGEALGRRFRLGSGVKVRITGVNIERRRIEMELVEGGEGGGKRGRTRGPRRYSTAKRR